MEPPSRRLVHLLCGMSSPDMVSEDTTASLCVFGAKLHYVPEIFFGLLPLRYVRAFTSFSFILQYYSGHCFSLDFKLSWIIQISWPLVTWSSLLKLE